MKSNFEQKQFEKEEIPGYKEIYEAVQNADIVSGHENKNWSIEDLESQLSSTLRLSGEKSLEDNSGTIYTTLSGGLDSTLALALLRKNFPDAKIVTFTMGGDENHPDIKYARLASQRFNAENIEIIPKPEEIQEALAEYQEKFPGLNLEEAVEKGDFDVYLLYKHISRLAPKSLIVHDGIDELMGGYWNHRKDNTIEERRRIFADYWRKLIPEHLEPLIKTNQSFNIRLIFPFLDEKLIRAISEIPVEDRASDRMGKKPLRKIAEILGIPEEIIKREKRGQLGMTEIESLRKPK